MDTNIEEKIKSTIEKMRPFLINDGGDLEYIKYEDNIVYIKLKGACQGCPMMDITIKEGIEQLLVNEIPEIKEVRNVS
ncbi:MAG: NifU family protein [bacterium]|nr:NifU family protein [Mycoplasmatota bacterium]MDD6757701.1 NifU family protein [bacterium]MDY2907777.1 NifU family protein [Candidatus Faecimonas sp.]